jgi:hypothetical protein
MTGCDGMRAATGCRSGICTGLPSARCRRRRRSGRRRRRRPCRRSAGSSRTRRGAAWPEPKRPPIGSRGKGRACGGLADGPAWRGEGWTLFIRSPGPAARAAARAWSMTSRVDRGCRCAEGVALIGSGGGAGREVEDVVQRLGDRGERLAERRMGTTSGRRARGRTPGFRLRLPDPGRRPRRARTARARRRRRAAQRAAGRGEDRLRLGVNLFRDGGEGREGRLGFGVEYRDVLWWTFRSDLGLGFGSSRQGQTRRRPKRCSNLRRASSSMRGGALFAQADALGQIVGGGRS